MTDQPIDLLNTQGLISPVADAARSLTLGGFRALWAGQAPTAAELAGDTDAMAEAIRHLQAAGRLELSADGRILGVHGLTRRNTVAASSTPMAASTHGAPSTRSASPPHYASTPGPTRAAPPADET